MMVCDRNLLFQGFIFRVHVSFTGCIATTNLERKMIWTIHRIEGIMCNMLIFRGVRSEKKTDAPLMWDIQMMDVWLHPPPEV